MPCDPQVLLCARLIQTAYAMADASHEPDVATVLAGYGLTLDAVIEGVDPMSGPTPFGFIASAADRTTYCAFRGTDSAVEGFEDAEFFQSACPLAPGANWEDGFGRVFNSLTVNGQPLTAYLEDEELDPATWNNTVFTGHSLGAPLALFAALCAGAKAVHLFESPRPGNAALAAAVAASSWFPASTSWAVEDDWVPDWPKGLWPLVSDYAQAIPLRYLPRNLVSPPIAADPLSCHRLASVTALLQALP